MTSLRLYQVDAFTAKAFGGNPAAVCLLPPGATLSDPECLQIAQEMNLSETAYVQPVYDVKDGNPFKTCSRFKLRWFTPSCEVALCGHATLATAAALCQGEGNLMETLFFDTQLSGQLSVKRLDDTKRPLLQLRMPFNEAKDPLPDGITAESEFVKLIVGEALIKDIVFHSSLRYLLLQIVDGNAKSIADLEPRIARLKTLQGGADPVFGVIVAAATDDDPHHEVHMRFWAPWTLDWEDAVTGSAQSVVGPHFERLLGKTKLRVHQASKRGGELALDIDRANGCVYAAGQCAIIFDGSLHF